MYIQHIVDLNFNILNTSIMQSNPSCSLKMHKFEPWHKL